MGALESWKAGWTLHQIAHLFDRSHGSVRGILAQSGSIRPPETHRSRLALTLAEREEISLALVIGHSIRSIAVRMGRAPSTVSREIERNGGRVGYRATQAAAELGIGRIVPSAENRALARVVTDKLRLLWSPEQIAGWLKHTYPCDETFHVSHETIYRSLFIQARGALKKELLEHLRRTRGMRRS
ncbi:IS30 family transposase, partial [Variovorax sp. GrIS 2.14]